jgi:hypothetical protein
VRPGEVATHAPIRWGASETKTLTVDPIVGFATSLVPQFVDLRLPLGPQQLSLALYALTAAPIAGVSVRWTIGIGTGSTNHEEVFNVAASDLIDQVPLQIVRPAMTLQIAASITTTVTKNVKLVVLVAPTSPTWLTEIGCIVPVRED